MLRWGIFVIGAFLLIFDIAFWYSLPTPAAIMPVNIFLIVVAGPALVAPWLGKRAQK
jgi:hypothetical protein